MTGVAPTLNRPPPSRRPDPPVRRGQAGRNQQEDRGSRNSTGAGKVKQAHTSAQTFLREASQLADGVGVRRQPAVRRYKRAYNGIRLNVTV